MASTLHSGLQASSGELGRLEVRERDVRHREMQRSGREARRRETHMQRSGTGRGGKTSLYLFAPGASRWKIRR